MRSHPQTLNYERRPSRTKQLIIGLIVLSLGAYWAVQAFRRGQFMADPSGVAFITSTRPANGEKNVLPNTFIQAHLNPGLALDPESIDLQTVRLYRTSDKQIVPANISVSAAGDAITLTPLNMLEPATQYTFEVKGARDLSDAEVMPFDMTFTTSQGTPATTYPVGFEKLDLPSEQAYYTGLTIGPDRCLYAGTADGKIIRRQIRQDGTLASESQAITTVQAANRGPRLITGIAFDPASTKDDLKLWVSHGQLILNERGEPSLVGAEEWTGKISTVSGPDLADYRDVIINLPRSWRDHLNNQIAFGPDGCAYWSQGSHTAMGAPTKKWGMHRPERLLSAAVLRLDPRKLPADRPLDAKTSDGGGTYDPFAKDAPLTLFATGVRLGYEMLWHSNGRLYTAVNGSAEGGRAPGNAGVNTAAIRRFDAQRGPYDGGDVLPMNISATQPDLLLRLEQGGYYGHPNPARAEYVLFGGNPTKGLDPYEVTNYPVGTRPDRNWRPPAYSFGTSVSPNGMIEFKSGGKLFGGALDGKLLVTRFSGGSDIIVLSLDDDGNVAESVTGIAGLSQFTQPLDLAQDPQTGCIYVAEYQGERLSILRPITNEDRLDHLEQHIFRQQVRLSFHD